MVKVTGKSLIPVRFDALEQFLNSVVPQDKLPEFNIKLDARSNAKSTFAKLAGKDLTIYTGTIVNAGSVRFPEITDVESLLMLFTIYGIKNAGAGIDFEIKNTDAGISGLRIDVTFQMLSEKLHFFMDRFRPMNAVPVQQNMFDSAVMPAPETPKNAVAEQASVKEQKKDAKVGVSPFKDVPLGDTPKIQVPEGLDLRMV